MNVLSIDPELHYCYCGYTWKPGLYHKLVMLVKVEYRLTCPQCQTVMIFTLVNHVVKVKTQDIKNRDRIWENG